MTAATQVNFANLARERMARLGLTNEQLRREFRVHRNTISLAIRVPAALPAMHRRIARRLSLKPVV